MLENDKGNVFMKKAQEYIIFPLDVPSIAEAKKYIELLAGRVGLFKVGLELFVSAGPEIIRYIHDAGSTGVFLDLKLHDIPETVSRTMNVIADLEVRFATIHCGESKAMLEAAVAGGRAKVGVLGVTVLTSVFSDDIRAAGFKEEFSLDLSKLVMKKAAMAKDAGCSGIVCSGLEVQGIKQNFGKDFVAVTPGIRPDWGLESKDDQKRVTTPAQAVQNGADYLVVGRPIRDAKDPKAAAQKIADEIEAVKVPAVH